MTTAEIERRLAVALRAADDVPVDVAGARRELVRRSQGEHTWRPRLVAVAASVLLLAIVTVSLLVSLDDHREPSLPTDEPTFSPSGLPVGTLRGALPPGSESGEPSGATRIVFVVRADGTGSYWRTDFGVEGELAVTFRSEARGRAVVGYTGVACVDPQALTLDFTVRPRTVTIDRATSSEAGDCLVSPYGAALLTGVTLHVHPLPRSE